MKTFEEAFAETGYLYGEDALEQVRLGWELAEKESIEREIQLRGAFASERAAYEKLVADLKVRAAEWERLAEYAADNFRRRNREALALENRLKDLEYALKQDGETIRMHEQEIEKLYDERKALP